MSKWFERIRLLGGLRVSGKILVKLKQGVGGGQTTVTTLMKVVLRVRVMVRNLTENDGENNVENE